MPLNVTRHAPTHRATCDQCGATSDAYGHRPWMIEGLRRENWLVARVWLFWWRVLCTSCNGRRIAEDARKEAREWISSTTPR